MSENEHQGYGEVTTGFESGQEVIEDWAAEIEHVSGNLAGAHADGQYSVAVPEAGHDYNSFVGMVDSYGEMADEVGEHHEDGHAVSVDWVGPGEHRGIVGHSDTYNPDANQVPDHDYGTQTSWDSYATETTADEGSESWFE